MEDSLELPDDTECINLQNLLSPQPLIKNSRENSPPHSLAYSNSTCVKNKLIEINMRSPLAFESNAQTGECSPAKTGHIKINNENNPINNQKTKFSSPQRQTEKNEASSKKKIHTLQKALNEKNIIIDRQNNQFKEVQHQIQILKQKMQQERSITGRLRQEIEKLVEERQSLMGYIDEQKQVLKQKISTIAQLQSQIHRMGDKQSHYTNLQRPKLITQLSELKLQNKKLNEQIDNIRMEMNLMETSLKQELQKMQIKYEESNNKLIYQQQKIANIKKASQKAIQRSLKSVEAQVNDQEKSVLIKQLDLLKQQRDYYMVEYRKRTQQSAKLYALQLKLAILEKQDELT